MVKLSQTRNSINYVLLWHYCVSSRTVSTLGAYGTSLTKSSALQQNVNPLLGSPVSQSTQGSKWHTFVAASESCVTSWWWYDTLLICSTATALSTDGSYTTWPNKKNILLLAITARIHMRILSPYRHSTPYNQIMFFIFHFAVDLKPNNLYWELTTRSA